MGTTSRMDVAYHDRIGSARPIGDGSSDGRARKAAMTHGSLVRGGLLVLLLSGGRAEVIGNMNAPVRPR